MRREGRYPKSHLLRQAPQLSRHQLGVEANAENQELPLAGIMVWNTPKGNSQQIKLKESGIDALIGECVAAAF
jgi:hypothetical protein